MGSYLFLWLPTCEMPCATLSRSHAWSTPRLFPLSFPGGRGSSEVWFQLVMYAEHLLISWLHPGD